MPARTRGSRSPHADPHPRVEELACRPAPAGRGVRMPTRNSCARLRGARMPQRDYFSCGSRSPHADTHPLLRSLARSSYAAA